MSLEQEYKKINTVIRTTNESIHVLKAEWTFLNRPERLQQLAQKHLDFFPIDAKQLISLKTLSEDYFIPFTPEEDRQGLDQLVSQLITSPPSNTEEN